MLIGLISDTHIPEVARVLPGQVREVFRGVDLILHCGDIYFAQVLDELESIAPVLAAMGDDDYINMRHDRRVKLRHYLTLEGLSLCLMHELASPWLSGPRQTASAVGYGDEKSPDIIVFGHTHMSLVRNHGGVLMVNPGSPTFPNYRPELGTVALLTVNSGKAEACVVQLGSSL